MGLRDRDAAGAEGALKDGEGEREGTGAFESVGEEASESSLGRTARSHGDKRLEKLVDYLCSAGLGVGREERERIWVMASFPKRREQLGDFLVALRRHCFFEGFLERRH